MQMMITIKYSSRGAQLKLLLFLFLTGLIYFNYIVILVNKVFNEMVHIL